MSAIYLGVVVGAHDWPVGFLQSRVPPSLGQALAVERTQLTLGEIDTLRTTAATLLLAKAQSADTVAANLAPPEPRLVKHVLSEDAIEVLQKAVALVGNPALTRAHTLARHLRDVLRARAHSPPGDSVLKATGIVALKPLVSA